MYEIDGMSIDELHKALTSEPVYVSPIKQKMIETFVSKAVVKSDTVSILWGHLFQAKWLTEKGEIGEALRLAKAVLEQKDCPDILAFETHRYLRDVYARMNALDLAIEHHQALDWRFTSDRSERIAPEGFLATAFLKLEEYQQAERIAQNTIYKMKIARLHYWEMSYTNTLGVIYLEQNKLDSAWNCFKRAEKLLYRYYTPDSNMTDFEFNLIKGLFVGNKAQVLANQGRHLEAIPLFKVDIATSLYDSSQIGKIENGIRSLLYLSDSYTALSLYDKADQCLRRANRLINKYGLHYLDENKLKSELMFYRKKKNIDTAFIILERLMALRDSAGFEQTKLYSSIALSDSEYSMEDLLQGYPKNQPKAEADDSFFSSIPLSAWSIGFLLICVLVLSFIVIKQMIKSNEALKAKSKKIEHQKTVIDFTLTEKETLLKEVHHRVKNNLQIVSSLLFFQAKNVRDPEAKRVMQEGQARIQTMAHIHQTLYQEDMLEQLDFEEYVRDLTNQIISSYKLGEESILIYLNIQKLQIPVDKAIPVGLILHELVTNSIKHAFSKGKKGSIRLSLEALGNEAILTYSDSGPGLSKKQDLGKSKSVGMKLITLLTGQLKGEFKSKALNSFLVELRFPLK